MPPIDLVFDPDCPNLEPARRQLRVACVEVGLSPQWEEWNRTDPLIPEHLLDFGSPTILVDGRDVTGELPAGPAACCRLYSGADGRNMGVPPLEAIVHALAARL
jgi:mercuric ion transport protein